MTLPAPVRGVAESAARDHAECAKLAAESIVQLAHPGASLNIPDNANDVQIIAALHAQYPDIQAQVGNGNAADLVAQFVPQGIYVLALVNCNGYAVPTPAVTGLRHWIAIYDTVPDFYQVWNSSYDAIANLRACSVNGPYHVLIKLPQGASDMLTQSHKDAMIKLAYMCGMFRDPESMTTETNWANTIADDGSNMDQVLTQILDSGEAQGARSSLHSADAGVPQLQKQIDALQAQLATLQPQSAGGLTAVQVQQMVHDEVVKALKAGEAGA